MHVLPNGCSRSNINVSPAHWQSKRASVRKPWLIKYRFYDPAVKGGPQWGWPVTIKGMNRFKTLAERQRITAGLIQQELDDLSKGWNPVTRQFVSPIRGVTPDIDPGTPFIAALTLAEPRVEAVEEVHSDMRSIIKAVGQASQALYDNQNRRLYKDLPVDKIGSRHLIFIMEQCQKNNPQLSDKRYNRYLAYLSMLFNKLISLQAVTANPVDKVERKKTVVRKRAILTDQEAKIIDEHLFKKDYYLWRFMHVFFHSGARNSELKALKKAKVDLARQEFTVVVKKGSQYEEHTRIISKQVLHLWQEVTSEAGQDDLLFGAQLRPGPQPQGERYVSKKWQEYVKIELGIDKDFNSLRHKRSDLVAARLSLKHSQQAMGHTSEKTTRIYAVGEDERRNEELKNLDISLTG